jgi:acyl-coenzyme A thioesterase PaaI-like protein
LTVEFKVNFLAPARGPGFVAIGRVLRSGRQLTVCSGEVLGMDGAELSAVAQMQATMIAVAG